MQGFSVPRDVALQTRHGWRRVLAPAEPGPPDPSRIVLTIHGEDELAQLALAQGAPEGAPQDLLRHDEADLARRPGWPMRLGRLAARRADAFTLFSAPAALPAQLAALRARHPGRLHFRIAIAGGFGASLGDTLVGATAWRAALPVLRAGLGSVDAEVLLGPVTHAAVAELIAHEDGIARVSYIPPTVQDFGRFDAFFDFTDLLGMPRYGDMPMTDWLLWWLGLDPAAVPAAAKRNRLRLPEPARDWARQRLAARPGPRIAFVWRASVPLRSMPDDVASRFAADLLDAAPGITLVTERALGLDHPRLLDLGAETDSAERMMALVADADGLVSVDSLAPHVADAADVPTVLLLNSFPPWRYDAYPGMRIRVPPGMEALPGWGLTKVDDARWEAMRDDYAAAWRGVSAADCWALLADALVARPAPERRTGVAVGPAWDARAVPLPRAGSPFPRDVRDAVDVLATTEMARFAARVLAPGRTAVLAGGGDGELALELAGMVAPSGRLHVLEPRRLRAQKLAADAQALGLATLHLWPAQAAETGGHRTIPDFDPAGEADPGRWGNLEARVQVATLPIDALDLDACRALVLAPPQDAAAALAGASALLQRSDLLVVAGPVPDAELAALGTLLAGMGYRGFARRLDGTDAAVLLAVPSGAKVRFDGLHPL